MQQIAGDLQEDQMNFHGQSETEMIEDQIMQKILEESKN